VSAVQARAYTAYRVVVRIRDTPAGSGNQSRNRRVETAFVVAAEWQQTRGD